MTPASARLRWAAEVAAPRPGDRVLEVGCGHGVLLGLLADRVTEGLVVGLDRSPTMTAAATARNREAVAAGRVRLRTGALLDADLDLDAGAFDLVVAVHVGAFWRPPAHEYATVRRLLAPAGRLLLVTQPLQSRDAVEAADRVGALAASSGLGVRSVHGADTPPRPSIAVELVPAGGVTDTPSSGQRGPFLPGGARQKERSTRVRSAVDRRVTSASGANASNACGQPGCTCSSVLTPAAASRRA